MSGLTRDEVEVFANGLYYLANIDGIDEKEESLIREFLTESGTDLTWEEIAQEGFDPIEAAGLLRGTFLRRIFISAAVAVVKADGEFSNPERRALGEIADAFGISNAEFGDIEQAASTGLA
jgi:tellurite resistance protein